MTIFIVSGEVSGDLYGAALAQELKRKDPSLTIVAVGGEKLREVSDYFFYDIAHTSAIGIWEQLFLFKIKLHFLNSIRKFLKTSSVDKVIIIDFQHLNFKLASIFKKFDIPIYTYITPNFWIWKNKKLAKKVLAYSEKVFTIFQKEYDFYSTLEPEKVYYFGHPLIELVEDRPRPSQPSLFTLKRILFLPGSRVQEIKLYLSTMVKIAEKIHDTSPESTFTIAVSSDKHLQLINSLLQSDIVSFTLSHEKTSELMKTSDFLICASGSATLEAVILNIPMVVLAAISPVTYCIARFILRLHVPFISLPNIVANDLVVPEFVQNNINPDSIFKTVQSFKSPSKLAALFKNYALVKASLKVGSFSIRNVADEILTIKS